MLYFSRDPHVSRRRRHLALAAAVVVGLHLVVLLETPRHLKGGFMAAAVESPATSSPPPQDSMHTEPSRAHHPSPARLHLSWQPAVRVEPASPDHATGEAPVPQPSSTPESERTETLLLAQATPEGEQSLRPAGKGERGPAIFKVPESGRLQFDVLGKIKGFGYTVGGELSWQQDGRQYQARFEIGLPLLGSRVQTSQGAITPEGLAPARFGDRVRSEQAAHFEREKGLISFSANTPSAPLEPGAQDRLSLFMQLAAQLAGAPQRYPAGTLITLQIVSAREAEPWVFRVDATESLQLPVGSMTAVRLTRLPRQPYDQQVDLWFAPSLDYLPVRLRVTHPNGDVADQVLRRLDRP